MSVPLKAETARFTTKGQVVIPSRIRKQFDIEEGTKCVVQATREGILLKPVTAALIRRGRGILKRSPSPQSDRIAHKRAEIKLENRHVG